MAVGSGSRLRGHGGLFGQTSVVGLLRAAAVRSAESAERQHVRVAGQSVRRSGGRVPGGGDVPHGRRRGNQNNRPTVAEC